MWDSPDSSGRKLQQGNSQVLDHLLTSQALTRAARRDYDIVHLASSPA
ncbi:MULTISPECIES: hypothetical protein [Streptomyces]|nr:MULTISPECIES: hypothetical protein [Streptomyces]QRX91634.1 hypothetical protein JNO44_12995 [Streptomyces noursei]UJB41407.1 hypothetical protein HRD51_11710 [Streptomyces sp. A1-5]